MRPPRPLVRFQLNGPAIVSAVDVPAGIVLRTLWPATDLPLIADLYNDAFELTGSEAVTARKIDLLAFHPGLHPLGAFLAFAGDLAVGVGVGRVSVPVRGAAACEGSIELVAVRPGHQGRGLGRALTRAVLFWLAQQKITRISASTDNPAMASILEGCGFRPIERFEEEGVSPAHVRRSP